MCWDELVSRSRVVRSRGDKVTSDAKIDEMNDSHGADRPIQHARVDNLPPLHLHSYLRHSYRECFLKVFRKA